MNKIWRDKLPPGGAVHVDERDASSRIMVIYNRTMDIRKPQKTSLGL